MIRVLIVDDSAFFRSVIEKMLSCDPEIVVVGIAKDGKAGIEQVKKLNPDVVTMDIEMPSMDGIAALKVIMEENPTPVIMVSSLTVEGAEATFKALDIGAVDFIPKYHGSLSNFDFGSLSNDLCTKVKAVAARFKNSKPTPLKLKKSKDLTFYGSKSSAVRYIVAIGVSTGGPLAVQKFLSELPKNFSACILIAQHMPAAFSKPFAERLNNTCSLHVREAESGLPVKEGLVYVSPGGKHLRLDMKGLLPYISVVDEPKTARYKPSVDVLMESVGQSFPKKAVGVIMTGMGNDGAEGAKVLKENGGFIIAQDEASCIVYGMPKAIVTAGLADAVVNLDNLAVEVCSALYKA